MRRLTTALVLLGGATVLMTSAPPAASAPSREYRSRAVPDIFASEVAVVDQQVARLASRQDRVPDYPEPSRDPFSFGHRPEPRRPSPPPAEMPIQDQKPAPMLPRLVAVMTASGGTRTAVLTAGDDVAFVAPGDRSGAFVVASIAENGVVLVEPDSGASFTLPLQ
jgi:hypothetical protein